MANDPQVFCANISGLNVHAVGFYDFITRSNSTFWDVGNTMALILKRESDQYGVDFMTIFVHETFTATPSQLFTRNQYGDPNNPWLHHAATKVFAQVRMFMKYRNQADTGGSSASNTTLSTRAATNMQASSNVYVPLEVVE